MTSLKLTISLLLALLLLCAPVAAFAAEAVPDLAKSCSLTVELRVGETAISRAGLTVYTVAVAENRNGGLGFKFTEDFIGFGGDPGELGSSEDASRLYDYAERNAVSGVTGRTGADGVVKFGGLVPGLYLVAQTGSASGFFSFAPFLVYVPASENGVWLYDIEAAPKTNFIRLTELSVEKVWNDGGAADRPSSVTLELLRGGAVVDTVRLSDENGWKHTWSGLLESDSYSVREADVPKGYTVSYSRSGSLFTVTNSTALVQTGQLTWPIPILAGGGLLLFGVGLVLYRRKNEEA